MVAASDIEVYMLTESRGFEYVDKHTDLYEVVMELVEDKKDIWNIVILQNGTEGELTLMTNVYPESVRLN